MSTPTVPTMPDRPPPTDEQLAAAARDGVAAAWDDLIERYHAPLLRYLIARTGDRELAAELGQDTFLAAVGLLPRRPPDRPFAPWLYRIAQNHLRRSWKRRRLQRAVSLDWLFGPDGAAPVPPRQPLDVEDAVADGEAVRAALGGLSPRLREALLLHSLDGFTAPEVAQILGISLAAAERRISRAKEQFRQRYRALAGDDIQTWDSPGRGWAADQPSQGTNRVAILGRRHRRALGEEEDERELEPLAWVPSRVR